MSKSQVRTENVTMNRLIRSILVLFGALAALTATSAMARNVVAKADQIAAVLKSSGRTAEVKNAGGERYVLAEVSGHKYAILALGCDDEGELCKSVQFFAAFEPENRPTLESMNNYARNLRWGRIYLDNEGEAILEFDLDLEKGGMSSALFLDNVAKWEAMVSGYAKFVTGKQ